MKRKEFFSVIALVAIALQFSQCTTTKQQASSAKKPEVKNVIFMIGDGMGLAQVYAGMTANKGTLNFERVQAVGLAKTYSSDSYVTDSAASGTAIACGTKTTNGTIGLDPQGNRVKSMLEYAEEHNKATGIVVTSSVTHATPASFVAHQQHRGMEEEIAVDLVQSGVDVFIGGGRQFFEKRSDEQNLTAQLQSKGYNIAYTLDDVKTTQSSKFGALLSDNSMPAYDSRGDMLPVSVEAALRILDKDKNGFFLMVEGSHIDGGGHSNNTDMTIGEVLDFDKAVKLAIDYAERNPETLVVITADHETGGLSLVQGDIEKGEVQASFSTTGHTGIMVPVYAFGPGAEDFTGIYENTDLLQRVLNLFGFKY